MLSSAVVSSPKIVAPRPARAPRVAVQASAVKQQQQRKEQNKVGAAALALVAAVVVSVSASGPVHADEIKSKICAGNPTAKICLKNSAVKK